MNGNYSFAIDLLFCTKVWFNLLKDTISQTKETTSMTCTGYLNAKHLIDLFICLFLKASAEIYKVNGYTCL